MFQVFFLQSELCPFFWFEKSIFKSQRSFREFAFLMRTSFNTNSWNTRKLLKGHQRYQSVKSAKEAAQKKAIEAMRCFRKFSIRIAPSPSCSHLLASMSGICQPQKFFTLPWPLFRRTQHSLSLKMSMTGVTISELASITSGSVKKHNSRHGGPPLEGSWSRLLAGSWLPF